MTRLWPLVVFLAILIPSPAVAGAEYHGPVVSVLDGDTIEVLHNHHPERIRLSGIDCPEKGQAYGKQGQARRAHLAFGKEVTVQTHGHDKYKRTLGDVILPDGMNVNQELRQARLVLVVSNVCARGYGAGRLETEAREARKGLWADPQPVPPWAWRKRRD